MDTILNNYYTETTIKTLNSGRRFYRNNISRRNNRDYVIEYVVVLERNNKYITFKDNYNVRIMSNKISGDEFKSILDKIKVKYEDEILVDLYLLSLKIKDRRDRKC